MPNKDPQSEAAFWKEAAGRYMRESWQWQQRAERAERLLQDGLAPKEIGRGQCLKDLEIKNERLKEEVRRMQLDAEHKNSILQATGLIVNCTGCLRGGPTGYQDLTEEKVQEVEQIAKRLRIWWTNNRKRIPPKEPAANTQNSDP